MDLIYTDSKRVDQGVILNPDLDMEIGGEEDFALVLPTDFKLEAQAFIYMERSEIFGIVDGCSVETSEHTITYSGRTIRGIMASKIIEPPAGQDYRVVTGNVSDILNTFARECGIGDICRFDGRVANVNNIKIDRYTTFLEAADKLMAQVDMKMTFQYSLGKMLISLVPVFDYSENIEYDNRNIGFSVKQDFALPNHVICLGRGDLAQRQVIHLYADTDGNISKTQTLFGLDEVAIIYDYSSAESLEELEKGGVKRLQEVQKNSMKVTLLESDQYDVGDIVGGREEITGIEIKEKITAKIIKIKDGIMSTEYKVGEKL